MHTEQLRMYACNMFIVAFQTVMKQTLYCSAFFTNTEKFAGNAQEKQHVHKCMLKI